MQIRPCGRLIATQLALDAAALRAAIRAEYAEVAAHPDRGFHSHTGRPLARLLGYEDAWMKGGAASWCT